jgi:hypothetical protein
MNLRCLLPNPNSRFWLRPIALATLNWHNSTNSRPCNNSNPPLSCLHQHSKQRATYNSSSNRKFIRLCRWAPPPPPLVDGERKRKSNIISSVNTSAQLAPHVLTECIRTGHSGSHSYSEPGFAIFYTWGAQPGVSNSTRTPGRATHARAIATYTSSTSLAAHATSPNTTTALPWHIGTQAKLSSSYGTGHFFEAGPFQAQ